VSTRLDALKTTATQIEAAARGAWRRGGRVILDAAGLIRDAAVGDVPKFVLAALRAALSARTADTYPTSAAFSYLLRAQSTFCRHTDSTPEDCT